jgi:hypothetical protein
MERQCDRTPGNAPLNDFLRRQGAPARVISGPEGTADPQRIREKYATRAAALYREKLEAAADGRPWREPPLER